MNRPFTRTFGCGNSGFTPALLLFGVTMFARLSAADGEPPKSWHGSGALGLTVTKGNSDTLLFNVNAQIEKEFSKTDSAKGGADYTFGEQKISGVRTTTASNFH